MVWMHLLGLLIVVFDAKPILDHLWIRIWLLGLLSSFRQCSPA